jgi:hypothetical protein
VVPNPGLRNRIFVDQNENRDLISAAFFAQNPNPGSDRAYAKRQICDVSCPVGAVGGRLVGAVKGQGFGFVVASPVSVIARQQV